MKRFVALLLILFSCGLMADEFPDEETDKQDKQDNKPSAEQLQLIKEARERAKLRAQKDERYYSKAEQQAIEELYQSWSKAKGSDQKNIAQAMQKKYPEANRTGCVMYTQALRSTGKERISRLRQVIKNYDDCYFYSGVQVGAIARYRLGVILLKEGKKSEAEKYFNELRLSYKDAINVKGVLFIDLIQVKEE